MRRSGRSGLPTAVSSLGRADIEVRAKAGAELNGQVRKPGEPLDFLIDDPSLVAKLGRGAAPLRRQSLSRRHELRRDRLRTIRLLQEPDAHGRSFDSKLTAGGSESGANWIPTIPSSRAIATRLSKEQIETCARST